MKIGITGAHSFTGRYVAQLLIKRGFKIVNFTNHPNRPWKIHSEHIEDVPLIFEKKHLQQHLKGCQALVQTYWVRFDNTLGMSREQVTNNSKMLIDCAREASLDKVVYTSHTQTSLDSPFPYIREKARVEQYLKESGVGWGIVRPCAIFGRTPEQSILINNISYLVRKFPLFPMPGHGNYPLQFVHAQDMAELIVNSIFSDKNIDVDAVGPQKVTFKEIIDHCSKQFNVVCKTVPNINENILHLLTQPMNWYFDDILMDKNDMGLMTSGLTCSHQPPTGKTSFLRWIGQNKDGLGRKWISSVGRYYQ